MPGHKGRLGKISARLDLTEISGADVLYSPSGIILESENKTSEIFNTGHTFYSVEGASLAIKAMIATALKESEKRVILATRNAHKSFIYAAALLGISVVFVDGDGENSLCSCGVTKEKIDAVLKTRSDVFAVYLTSPDYLGNMLDIEGIAKVAHSHSIPLLVDNAHGAYLALLKENVHPIALGADMCADSAHKTLPSLTGTAYLHVSKNANPAFLKTARESLSLFASTSPSYLLLSSLDNLSDYLSKKARRDYEKTVLKVEKCKRKITNMGFELLFGEPLKITISPNSVGYLGTFLQNHLRKYKIECEYADNEYTVLMVSPKNSARDFSRLFRALKSLEVKEPVSSVFPRVSSFSEPIDIRSAFFAKGELLPLSLALGRVVKNIAVSCPPAIPVVICGERLTEERIEALRYYGYDEIEVVK